MKRYLVSTQHDNTDGVFIAPIAIRASSPVEAARERFLGMAKSSQDTTFALLVTDEDFHHLQGSARVFPVRAIGRAVAQDPLRVGEGA